MKDFSKWSDDDLLDEIDNLSLELSCLMGSEEGCWVERMYWMVMDEVNKRGLIDDKEDKTDDIEDKTEEKDNFGFGRDEERFDEYDLPF